MTVSMDGLRWQLVRNYNSLTRKLNSNIIDKPHDPEIRIDPDRIQNEMDQLRSLIVTLAYMYQEGEDGYKILENPTFESFNEEEEDEEE